MYRWKTKSPGLPSNVPSVSCDRTFSNFAKPGTPSVWRKNRSAATMSGTTQATCPKDVPTGMGEALGAMRFLLVRALEWLRAAETTRAWDCPHHLTLASRPHRAEVQE